MAANAIMSPASRQESILTSGEHLAVVWRSRVCGYCAEGLPLIQHFAPYTEGEYWHHDPENRSIYPCACIVQMLEDEMAIMRQTEKWKADRDAERLKMEEVWRKEEGYSELQRLGYGSTLDPTF
jgi:hypothetical protein